MKSLYITGGRQKDDAYGRKEWFRHKQGLILRIDLESNRTDVCVRYETPPDFCATEDPSILFKSGTIQKDNFYVCTQTEILIYKLPDFKLINHISLPCFNDLHHVRPTRHKTLLIANTGLDMVIETDRNGKILREWHVLGSESRQFFDKTTDYRKIATTKPHQAHPNYVFMHNDDIWVTRFEQRDAVCLNRQCGRINIGIQRPHDGFIYKNLIYFTTVDGHIVIADINTLSVKQIINLNGINGSMRALGWCRGLWVCNDEYIYVGFSRLRPTSWCNNINWLKGGFKMLTGFALLPTRIAMYNIKKHKLCWEKNLEDFGINVIFSIHYQET